MRPDPACPADLRDLTRAEHLIVFALRAFAVGRVDCVLVRRAFETSCGALAVEARAAFLVFAQQLARGARRRISVGAPGTVSLTRDEQQVCALFADAQAGDAARFDARISYLIGRPAEAPFFAAASVTATALAAGGRRTAPAALALGPDRRAASHEGGGVSARAAFGPPGLWNGERLILAGLRVWARCRLEGMAPQTVVVRAISCAASERVGALFVALMEAVEAGRRRPLRVKCSACPGYAEDEQRLVTACGVAAVDLPTAEALLRPLVREAEPAACLARALGAALACEGLRLPARLSDGAAPAAAPNLH